MRKRKLIFGMLAFLLLAFLYRLVTVYTVRSGECRPRVAASERTGFPPLRRPLVVMTYNIAGHEQLIHGDHIQEIASAIRRIGPDIVALQEVHRKTWQSRFHDQVAELKSLTGLQVWFAPSYEQWGGGYGNAILTRGRILKGELHPLPCIGEPRSLLEATIHIDGATVSFYATHLTAWGRINAENREEQLQCLARVVRTSRHPYILAGDLNTNPESPEMKEFRRQNVGRLANTGPTYPMLGEQLDYIFVDPGWQVRGSRTWPDTISDHLPVTAELFKRPAAMPGAPAGPGNAGASAP